MARSSQAKGISGRIVDRMIRNSVKARFRSVYWKEPVLAGSGPFIFVPNHHGWFDGYLMYVALTRLKVPFVDWIEEFEAFPLFGACGGMPYPAGDPHKRAKTIRTTIRLMRGSGMSLLLFAEGLLHSSPTLLPFGRSLELIAKKTEAQVVPVAIRYDMSLHERPEALILFGQPMDGDCSRVRDEVMSLLEEAEQVVQRGYDGLSVLQRGTLDVNERLDLRKMLRKHQ